MRQEESCGAVVFTCVSGERRYVLVRSREGIYGFPKGHREPGETPEETALREIREEVGLHVTLLPGFSAQDEYPLPKSPVRSSACASFSRSTGISRSCRRKRNWTAQDYIPMNRRCS